MVKLNANQGTFFLLNFVTLGHLRPRVKAFDLKNGSYTLNFLFLNILIYNGEIFNVSGLNTWNLIISAPFSTALKTNFFKFLKVPK